MATVALCSNERLVQKLLLLLLFFFSTCWTRVSVSPDGSIVLAGSGSEGVVRVDSELVVQGRYVGAELMALDNLLAVGEAATLYHINAQRYQQFDTSATGGTSFTALNGDTFLIIATGSDEQPLYRFNTDTKTFDALDPLLVGPEGALDWEFFSIDGTNYLVDGRDGQCHLRAFDASNGVLDIGTVVGGSGVTTDWEYHFFNGEHFLAQAITEGAAASRIYKWDGDEFTASSPESANAAQDWELFEIDGVLYAGLAKTADNEILFWSYDGVDTWTPENPITATEPYDLETFQAGNSTFLVVVYANTTAVYEWTGSQFAPITDSEIETEGARDATVVHVGSEVFLAVANFNTGAYEASSALFKWSGGLRKFLPVSSVSGSRAEAAVAWIPITTSEGKYLYLAASSPSFMYKIGIFF